MGTAACPSLESTYHLDSSSPRNIHLASYQNHSSSVSFQYHILQGSPAVPIFINQYLGLESSQSSIPQLPNNRLLTSIATVNSSLLLGPPAVSSSFLLISTSLEQPSNPRLPLLQSNRQFNSSFTAHSSFLLGPPAVSSSFLLILLNNRQIHGFTCYQTTGSLCPPSLQNLPFFWVHPRCPAFSFTKFQPAPNSLQSFDLARYHKDGSSTITRSSAFNTSILPVTTKATAFLAHMLLSF